MGLLEFNKLPINTLVGADWKTFNAITRGREIDAAYKGKYRLTKTFKTNDKEITLTANFNIHDADIIQVKPLGKNGGGRVESK